MRCSLRPLQASLLLLLAIGCRRPVAVSQGDATPTVAVATPVIRKVHDFADFTGRTEAVESVEVKARVSGYLVKIGFQPGAVVKGDEQANADNAAGLVGAVAAQTTVGATPAPVVTPPKLHGDLLFIIDPRPYQAALDLADAQVKLNEARFKHAKADYARALEVAKTPGAISQQDIDKYSAAREEALAQVTSSKANLEEARLNLEFTRVSAPISGKISWNYLTLGNLVTKDTTLLTTIVSEDPMYAYFDVDERAVLKLRGLMREGKLKAEGEGASLPVYLGLADEPGHPHQGVVDFVNNRVDASTGTITVRAVFSNEKPELGPRPLLPGQFGRIRMPLGDPYEATLVAEKAFGSDQGQKYLLVVDDKSVVQYRRVKLGPLQEDGLRVVLEGVKAGEQVVISGLQEVRPKMTVRVEPMEMPRTNLRVIENEQEIEVGPSRTGAKKAAAPKSRKK